MKQTQTRSHLWFLAALTALASLPMMLPASLAHAEPPGIYLSTPIEINGEKSPVSVNDDVSEYSKKAAEQLARQPDLTLIEGLDTHVMMYPLVGKGKDQHFDYLAPARDGGPICSDARQTNSTFLVCLQRRIDSYGSETNVAKEDIRAAATQFNGAAGGPQFDLQKFWQDVDSTQAGWGSKARDAVAALIKACGSDSACLGRAQVVQSAVQEYIAKNDIFTRAGAMQDRLWRDTAEPAPKHGPHALPDTGLIIYTGDKPREDPKKKPRQGGASSRGGTNGLGSGTGKGKGTGTGDGNGGNGSSKEDGSGNGTPGAPGTPGARGITGTTAATGPAAWNANASPQAKVFVQQLGNEAVREAQKQENKRQDQARAASQHGKGTGQMAGDGTGNGGIPGGTKPPGSERDVRSPTDPIVDLSWFGIGASKYPCPDFMAGHNCLPSDGTWAPKANSSGSPLTSSEIKDGYSALKPVMFQMLAEHAVKVMAEGYVMGLAATNPDTFATTSGLQGRISEFMSSASCLSPSAQKDLRQHMSGIALPTGARLDDLKEKMRARRLVLGADLYASAKAQSEAKSVIAKLAPRFTNEGDCGFIAMRLNHEMDAHSECSARFAELQNARGKDQEVAANYPFFALTIPADNGTPVWQLMAETKDESGTKALGIYDSVIGQSSAAALKRVQSICDDPQKEGKAAMLNPVIAQSFFSDPANNGAGWVFCAAYAENARNDELIKIAKTGFVIATVVCTGGTAGLVLGAGMVGMTVYDNYQKYDQLQRDKNDYLAGAGNVKAYEDARDGLEHFWRNAAIETGLASLSLVPGIGMLKSWMRARDLARVGKVVMEAETAGKLLAWYRTRALATLGKDAAQLSDAELLTLARAEASGADLSALRKAAGCVL